ncbi:MAG: hypothetical protein HGA96_06195 [Desulfobulbaceae bacterium]|nr:hypothetical protein [Desulfobulbaceae bacterium]
MLMRVKYFLLGLSVSLLMLFLTGAMNDPGAPSSANLSFGRYQISSWATSFGDKGGVVGAFVIDTFSGETKTVYSRMYGPAVEGEVIKNDLKKPFMSIQ